MYKTLSDIHQFIEQDSHPSSLLHTFLHVASLAPPELRYYSARISQCKTVKVEKEYLKKLNDTRQVHSEQFAVVFTELKIFVLSIVASYNAPKSTHYRGL